MRTAILISGHMRSFERCLPNLHWFVFRHFPDADFFVSTVRDANSPKAELLRAKYPKAHVEIDIVEKQPEIMMPPGAPLQWIPGKPYTHEPYFISVSPQAVVTQLWQLDRCWRIYEAARREAHQLIIRIRPDLWFQSFQMPYGKMRAIESEVAFTPWWGRFGGSNDRFALLGRDAAQAYFTTFSRIELLWNAGCPIHPESLVHASMQAAEIAICDDLKAEFSTLRENGEMRPPEITAVDMAHMKGS